MKRIITASALIVCLITASLGATACSGQSKSEKNAKEYLKVLYECPTKEYAEYFKATDNLNNQEAMKENTMPDMTDLLTPYATDEHAKEQALVYASGLQLNCMNGGTSKVKAVSVSEVKKGQLEATVDVICTSPEGVETELSLPILMNTDENDKVYFTRTPTNHIEYQLAVEGKEPYNHKK